MKGGFLYNFVYFSNKPGDPEAISTFLDIFLKNDWPLQKVIANYNI